LRFAGAKVHILFEVTKLFFVFLFKKNDNRIKTKEKHLR